MLLERPELRQLRLRIVARYHLGPLTKPEVAGYVRHRLDVSGAQRQLFPSRVMGRLYRLSGGVPRVINVLCDRALLGAYVQGKERIDRATLAQAAREVFRQPEARRSLPRALAASVIVLAGAARALTGDLKDRAETTPVPLQPNVAAPAAEAPPASVVPPDPKPEAALPETLEWLADERPGDSRALAYSALFRAWGADYRGGDACRQAESLGLRCQTARGGLDEIRELNRPAVLLLRDARGRELYATLSTLDDKSAGFALGEQTRTVAVGALAAQWSGQYTLFWRMPSNARENLSFGEHGPAVAWLSRQLAQAQGRAVDVNEDALFDEPLLRQVKQFQLTRGLIPDGVVGPRTLMRLAGVADNVAPTLLRKQGEH
jgi:general secretion pathway protein A